MGEAGLLALEAQALKALVFFGMTEAAMTMDEQTKRLMGFLSDLRPQALIKLIEGLEKERDSEVAKAYESILAKLRPMLRLLDIQRPGKMKPLRLLCMPFEPILFDDNRSLKQTGRISRASIIPIWFWLIEGLLPDTLPDLCARLDEHIEGADDEALQAAIAILHTTVSAAILRALEDANGKEKKLAPQLGSEDVLADAKEIAEVLSVAPMIMKLSQRLPKKIDQFDDQFIRTVQEIYDATYNERPSAAIYVPLCVMGRLSKPWEIMRLARKIALRNDDTMISQTDLSVLGNLLIEDMEAIGQQFKRIRPPEVDLLAIFEKAKRFADISSGMSREIDINRWGEWGKRLFAARNNVSGAITVLMARFGRDLAKALPLQRMGAYGRSGPRQPDLTKPPALDATSLVEGELKFLESCRKIGELIGVQADYKSVRHDIDAYLAAYEDGLVEEIRSAQDTALENARAFVEIVARLRAILSGDEAAEIFHRQASVAAGGL